jgi:glutamine---fructose-6-phosphate transaminase (isomerizing)
VATAGSPAARQHAEWVLEMPKVSPELAPALAILPLQVLAYRIASLRGLPIDQPRNLAKTVTVE